MQTVVILKYVITISVTENLIVIFFNMQQNELVQILCD